jgi:hypothetical protein
MPEAIDCGGPDVCCDDLCRGNDYGMCGVASDTETCLSIGVCGPHCTLDHDDEYLDDDYSDEDEVFA